MREPQRSDERSHEEHSDRREQHCEVVEGAPIGAVEDCDPPLVRHGILKHGARLLGTEMMKAIEECPKAEETGWHPYRIDGSF
ncbi:MAG: hypothetical protein ABGY42_05000 [bacterium]